MASIVFGKIGLHNGFSLHDLELSFFGSHVYGETPRYPLLEVSVSKVSPQFGWFYPKIWLLPYSIERQAPTHWFIKAKIYENQERESFDQYLDYSDLFKFEGVYSTKERIGAGKIIFSCLEYEQTADDSKKIEEAELIVENMKIGNCNNFVRDGLSACFLLWKCHYDYNFESNGKQKILELAEILLRISDYRVEYLAKSIIKKVNAFKKK